LLEVWGQCVSNLPTSSLYCNDRGLSFSNLPGCSIYVKACSFRFFVLIM